MGARCYHFDGLQKMPRHIAIRTYYSNTHPATDVGCNQLGVAPSLLGFRLAWGWYTMSGVGFEVKLKGHLCWDIEFIAEMVGAHFPSCL